tara:strand:+ start:1245 stop:2528 length:1284 start_codon:yes stop_codon:yes gene_type:complete
MTVNKGLLSLVENDPNFSNQAIENAVNEIINVDEDDGYLWIKSQFDLQTAIDNNTVLTTTQKNDVKASINSAHPHLNIGGFLKDIIRHTASIIDATIIPLEDADNPTPSTFLELLQQIQTVQNLIPELYGVPAKDKARAVDDHMGTLNNIFLTTDDSSEPVFTRLKNTITYLRNRGRILGGTNNFPISSAQHRYYNTQMIDFLTTLVADSTDFQTSLDYRTSLVTGSLDVISVRMGEEGFTQQRNDLVAFRDEINVQVQLENSNLVNIGTYIETLSNNTSFASLADDDALRQLMSRVAQDTNWQNYFTNYKSEQDNINPIYTTSTDSDKSAIIDQVLADSGLPDVIDFLNIEAVADKSERDDRIDTKGYDSLTIEQRITKSCEQLGLTTANNSIYDQSERLLNNMNQHDRDEIAKQLDLNESASTLS